MIKINLFAGPGSGKTTVALYVTAILSKKGYYVDIANEAAKNWVYDGVDLTKSDEIIQLKIFNEQLSKEQLLLKGGLDFVICDSPLLLNAYFSKIPYLIDLSLKNSNNDDFNFWIERYNQEHFNDNGRSHNIIQSKRIDNELKNFILADNRISNLITLSGDSEQKANEIIEIVEKKLKG